MSTMTLEPCPFCGAKDAEVYPRDRSNLAWNVCCGNPGCVTRGDNDYLTESDAVAAWNRRAHPSQPAQAVDVGSVKQCYGEVIRALAAIVNCPQTDAQCEAEVIPRDPVMHEVMRVRDAMDKLTRAISGEKAGPVDGWISVNERRPERNKPTIYWHKSEFGGFAAIADEWRDEHHLAYATHWLPYTAPDKDGL